MNNKKLLISLLSIISLVMFSSASFSATKGSSKPTFAKKTYSKSQKQRATTVRTKEYKVPGVAAIGYAKTHGYKFEAFDPTTTNQKGKCKFIGSHWQIGRNENCFIIAFRANHLPAKCKNLRKGWKIKRAEISGNFYWGSSRPVNTAKTQFEFRSDNDSRPTYPVSIRNITLIGPEGPFNKWQEAFNHCTENNYQG